MDLDILKLAELFNPKRGDHSDSEEEEEIDNEDAPKKEPSRTPATVGERKPSVYDKIKTEERKVIDTSDPANEDALFFSEEPEGAASDWRKTPQWNVSYKQKVTSSDVFLQMSGKGPGTASCEDMIIKIHLPEDDHRNVDLKVTKDHINLLSPKFRLEVPLPHPVDPQCGNAQWNKDTEELIVTLRMIREFDFLNF